MDGREAYRRRAWLDAFDALSEADAVAPLEAADLELLAMSAVLIRRDDDGVRAFERAYTLWLGLDDVRAARCGVWIGLVLINVGEFARANGWFSRAGRLLARSGQDCVERGYLLVPEVLQRLGGSALDDAVALAAEVVGIGERFADADLVAFGTQAKGRARIKQGRVGEGMALLDEAMVAVVAGELATPVFTGLIYCSVIDACQEVFDVRRAREWTDGLARWCDAQPQLVDFTGLCLVHRAECLQHQGEWPDAIDEARRACALLRTDELAAGAGYYRQAEIHRLYGQTTEAEDAYRHASELGWQPQPGLALLWLALSRTEAAVAAICRVLGETTEPLARARLLPAAVEILLAAGDIAAARTAQTELAGIAATHEQGVLAAMAAQSLGAVELADGNPTAALIALRAACQLWRDVEAPYEVARVRELVSHACRAFDDHQSADWELRAARDAFARLGATPDLDRLAQLLGARPAGLTARELQVLRLVAAGKANKVIAAELTLSERTVDRHVSSILTKLGVPSRTAATAYAFAHQIV